MTTEINKESFLDSLKADPVLSGYRIEILGEENVKNQENIILYSKNGYLKYYASIKDGKLNNIECSSFKTLKPIFFSNPAEILVKLDHLYDKVEPTRERILNKIKEEPQIHKIEPYFFELKSKDINFYLYIIPVLKFNKNYNFSIEWSVFVRGRKEFFLCLKEENFLEKILSLKE